MSFSASNEHLLFTNFLYQQLGHISVLSGDSFRKFSCSTGSVMLSKAYSPLEFFTSNLQPHCISFSYKFFCLFLIERCKKVSPFSSCSFISVPQSRRLFKDDALPEEARICDPLYICSSASFFCNSFFQISFPFSSFSKPKSR